MGGSVLCQKVLSLTLSCHVGSVSSHVITRKKMSIEQQDTVKEQEHIYIAFGLITVLFLLLTFHL